MAEATDGAETDGDGIDGSAETTDEAETDATEIDGSAETTDEAETDATGIDGSAGDDRRDGGRSFDKSDRRGPREQRTWRR